MNIILQIEPQKATQGTLRKAAVLSCHKDGSILMDGKDGLKPARFWLTPKDIFPWESFLGKLMIAWQLADYTSVPKAFLPQKRLPQFVLDEFPQESLDNKLKILALLRKRGYFPNLTERT